MDINRVSFINYLFLAGTIIDNNIFFLSEAENTLMTINMENWQVSYFDGFSRFHSALWGKADSLRAVGRNIFKLTLDGQFMEVLSVENGTCTKIPLNVGRKMWGNYAGFEVRKQYIYIIPRWERKVIQVDTVHFSRKEYNPTVKHDRKMPVSQFVKFAASYVEESSVWLFEAGNRQVDRLDIEKKVWSFYVLPIDIGNWSYVYRGKEQFYLLTEDNCLYEWNPCTNHNKLLWKNDKYCVTNRYFARFLMIQQRMIILLPNFGEDIVMIDLCSGEEVCYDEYPKDFSYLPVKSGKYPHYFEDADYYYYPMWMSEYLMRVDKRNGEIGWKKLIMPLKEERFQAQIRSGRVLSDDLKRYLYFQQQNVEKKYREGCLKIEKVGNRIWKTMKET